MLAVSLENVTTHYGAQPVLNGVTFQISYGQKLGLIGANGSGKTTILRVLLGQETPTSGSVTVPPSVQVGYVPQYVEYEENQTALDFLLAEHRQIFQKLRQKEDVLARASGSDMGKALREYQQARDSYDRIDGDTFPQRALSMLDALGLAGRADQRVESLSGGEKNVLSMTQALLAAPDLLILDEPGNHLDYMGVAWLEDFLKRFKGAVLVVSHNRYLLDRVVDGILELEDGRVHHYEGGYSAYRATRLRQLMAQQRDYVVNQRRLAQLEELVKRFEQKARTSNDAAWGKRLRARKSQLEREKKQAIEKPVLSQSSMRADFSTEATRANIALQIRGYSKSFGDLALFDSADLDIAGGERVALVGPNGSGKTSLLRDIVERGAWDSDTVRIGPSLRVGYSAQEQEVLGENRTIIEAIIASAPPDKSISSNDAFALLRRFMFTREDMSKHIAALSGGERNRVQLARLMILRANFLILDEPTNHLDILAQEAVEEALESFEGTILVVSHDRYFLDKIVNRVVEVRDSRLVSYDGNFTDFWYARQEAIPRVTGRVATRGRLRPELVEGSRQADRAERAASRTALTTLEQRIHDAEDQKLNLEKELTAAFTSGSIREGRRAQRQLDRISSLLNDLYDQWLRIGET